ncbi:MAG: methyl-accepting chemotaxis protein [Thermoleophilia bacterium]
MLRRIRVGQRLIAGFTLLILAVVAAAGVGVWKMSTMKDHANFIADNPLVATALLGDLNKAIAHYRLAQLEHVLATDPQVIAAQEKRLEEEAASVKKALDAYAPTIANAEDKALFDKVSADWAEYQRVTDQAVALDNAGKDIQARDLVAVEGTKVFDRMDADITDWFALNNTLADEAVSGTASAFSAAKMLLFVFVALAVLAGIGLALFITRSITGPLTQLKERLGQVGDGDLTVRLDVDGADELSDVGHTFNDFAGRIQDVMRKVSSAARQQVDIAGDMARGAEQAGLAVSQIASTIDEVARGSQEQAEQTSKVSETMSEMSEGVLKVAAAGETAAQMAEEADRLAGEGARTVEDATVAMTGIERRVADAAEIVEALGERGAQVGQIVDTISDIAGQTNLLALNAAIEAARAGELGRGFAVVADEVRKLAESTQQQVGSIAEIVGEIQEHTRKAVEAMEAGREEVTSGVQRVGAAGEAFGTIRERVTALSGEVMSVAAAAEELEAGANEVRESLSSVAAVSEENAASVQEVSASTEETSATAEETAAAAQQVSDSARSLDELVSAFRV